MRKGGLLSGLLLTGLTFANGSASCFGEERNRVPGRLSAFVPRTPLPTSDADGAGCRGTPGICHGRCEGDEFCGTLLSSDGKRYCGCSASHP